MESSLKSHQFSFVSNLLMKSLRNDLRTESLLAYLPRFLLNVFGKHAEHCAAISVEG